MKSRLTVCLFLILSCTLLTSCDKLLRIVQLALENNLKNSSKAREVRISPDAKPAVVAAFKAIGQAIDEHNRVLLKNIATDNPVNELAGSAGLEQLDRAARAHSGLAKQIINAVAASASYEKSLFVPFDTIRRQSKGMKTWTRNQALARRGYIQIVDDEIVTYDTAVAYLEHSEESLQRQNFDRQGVSREVADEFFRLRGLGGNVVLESRRGTFREGMAALQCYREALTSTTAAEANQYMADANQHEQKSKQFEDRMVAEIRKQLAAERLL